MKLILTVLATLIAFSKADDPESDEGVLVLTTANFEETIKNTDYALVMFYAPWCGHCKSLKPEYVKAAAEFAKDANIMLAKVDATVEPELAKTFGVRGYPTMKWFKKNPENAMEYGGGRTHPDIVSWIKKKTGPPAKKLGDVEATKAFKEENDVCVIGYFPEGQDSADFIAAADSLDDVPFGITDCEECAKELELAAGGVTLFKKFDEGFNKFESGDLATFVKENSLAYVTEFSDKTAPKIFGGDIKKHALVFSAASGSDHKQILDDFTAAAKQFRGKALYVFIDCDKADNGRILEFFGMKEEDCPDVRMIEMGKAMSKFKPPTQDLTEAGFVSFCNGVLDGSLQKHLMTEEIPEKNDEPVFYIVGKHFEEIAYAEDKAVFVEFYAPWCGHCKQLAPIWDKLGEHFKDDESIIIAKSDATANEFDGIQVQGFPTIKYFPKGEKKVVDYSGGRDLESLIKFVESEGITKEEGPEDDEDEEDVAPEDEGEDEAEGEEQAKDEL